MILEKQYRNSLNEGRSFGMGYSVLKKLEDNNYETYLPFTACKDYLNDLVYIENTGLKITKKIHGYSHSKKKIFQDKDYFHLGICTLDYNQFNYQHDGIRKWNEFETMNKILISNAENLLSHVHKLEERFGHSTLKSKIEKIDDVILFNDIKNGKSSFQAIILKVPTYWTVTPIMFSFYCMFIRLTFNILDDKISLEDLLDSVKYPPFIKGDQYFKGNLQVLLNSSNTKFYFNQYQYDLSLNSLNDIHNYGIINFSKRVEETEEKMKRLKLCS